jgi:hypothetical protein
MSIPVAQLFSMVADRAQQVFHYKPGMDKEGPLPTVVYQEEELQEVEMPYSEIYVKTEERNV